MRFTVTRELNRNPFFCWLLLLFSAPVLLFFVLNPFYEKSKWGLTPSAVQVQILGDEASFVEAMPLQEMVAQVHIELFIYPFILIMLFLVLFQTAHPMGLKLNAMIAAFAFCLMNGLAPFLVKYVHAGAAWLKPPAFWGLTVVASATALLNIPYLLKALRRAWRESVQTGT